MVAYVERALGRRHKTQMDTPVGPRTGVVQEVKSNQLVHENAVKHSTIKCNSTVKLTRVCIGYLDASTYAFYYTFWLFTLPPFSIKHT